MTPRPLALVILMSAMGDPARAEINLDIYADVDYSLRVQNDTTNQFAVPKMSLLYTQTYGKLGFLAEPLLEVEDTNDFIIDLDRLEITYTAEEWLRLKFGRFHSSVGYYNDAYHHAAIFMPSIARPLMVEDSGDGLIPAFSVGVHADGRIRAGQTLAIRYDVELANARGRNPDQTQSLFDLQNEKELVLRLRIELGGALDGLIVGGNLVLNWIPANADLGVNKMTERMYGAHVAYLEHNVHFISEALWVRHRDRVTDHVYEEYGAFAEFGYYFGNLLPFIRYERIHFLDPDKDPFFRDLSDEFGSFDSVTAGLKWTFDQHLAAKIAGNITGYDDHDTSYTVSLQLAAAF
jgi:hypothetical protein